MLAALMHKLLGALSPLVSNDDSRYQAEFDLREARTRAISHPSDFLLDSVRHALGYMIDHCAACN